MTIESLIQSFDTIKKQGTHKVGKSMFRIPKNSVDHFFGDISFMLWRIYEDDTFIVMDDHYFFEEPVQEEGYKHGDTTEYHTQDFIEFGYVYKGSFKQNIVGKDYTYNQGDVFLIDQHTMRYDYIKNCDTAVIFIKFTPTFIDSMFLSQLVEGDIKTLLGKMLQGEKRIHQFIQCNPKGQVEPVTDIVNQIISELTYRRDGWSYMLKGLLVRFIGALSTMYECNLYKFDLKKMDGIFFDQVIKYMEQHFRDVTIEDLVTRFHYNTAYYNRLIKRYSGLTYKQYLQRIRINYAKNELVSTTKPIMDIVIGAGYTNKGYFYKIFTESEELTPHQYREKYTRKASKSPYKL